MVVHFLIQNWNGTLIEKFHTFNITIDEQNLYCYNTLFIAYKNYLNERTLHSEVLILFKNSDLYESITSSETILAKIQEICTLMQKLADMRRPLKYLQNKGNTPNTILEIVIRALADSREFYIPLNSAINHLRAVYTGFKSIQITSVKERFLRYNQIISELKMFEEDWPAQCQGVFNYESISKESLKEVDSLMKENAKKNAGRTIPVGEEIKIENFSGNESVRGYEESNYDRNSLQSSNMNNPASRDSIRSNTTSTSTRASSLIQKQYRNIIINPPPRTSYFCQINPAFLVQLGNPFMLNHNHMWK